MLVKYFYTVDALLTGHLGTGPMAGQRNGRLNRILLVTKKNREIYTLKHLYCTYVLKKISIHKNKMYISTVYSVSYSQCFRRNQ